MFYAYTVAKIDTNTGATLSTKKFSNSVDATFYVNAMNSLDADKNVRYEVID